MPPEITSDELVGTTFAGCYAVSAVLGTGGSSTVYRAHNELLDQDVALKVLRVDRGASANLVRRLKTEARNSSKLRHPNIAGVMRIQMTPEGIPFLVSELVEGLPLNELLTKKGRLSEQEFFGIFDCILGGMEHAHAHGVIHCDLKPSNVIVQFDGEQIVKARIVDFGISKSITPNHKDSLANTPGGIFGTPAYMSPEQCRGEKPGERADIYSVACMMYESLSGETVFSAESVFDMIQHHITAAPRRFAELVPPLQVNPSIENAILSALAKDPRDRPQTMSELRALLYGHTEYPLANFRRSRGRRKQFVIGAVLLALICGAILIGNSIHISVSSVNLDSADRAQVRRAIQLPSTPAGLLGLGVEFDRANLSKDAIDALRRGNDLANREGKTDSYSLKVRFNIKAALADSLRGERYFADEERILQENLALATAYGQDRLPGILRELSDCAFNRGNQAAALDFAAKAAEAAERRFNELSDDRYSEHRQAGEMLRVLARRAEDLKQFDLAQSALSRALKHDDQHVLRTQRLIDLRSVAELKDTMGLKSDALAWMVKYTNLAKTGHGNSEDELDEVAIGYEFLGDLNLKYGDYKAAEIAFAKAVEISKYGERESVEILLAQRLFKHALSLFHLHRNNEADVVYDECERHYANLISRQGQSQSQSQSQSGADAVRLRRQHVDLIRVMNRAAAARGK